MKLINESYARNPTASRWQWFPCMIFPYISQNTEETNLMMNCSITTINRVWTALLITNEVKRAKILPVLSPIGVIKTTYLKFVTPVKQSNWRSRMGYVSANLQKWDRMSWRGQRYVCLSRKQSCVTQRLAYEAQAYVYIHAIQTDALVCILSLEDLLSTAGREDVWKCLGTYSASSISFLMSTSIPVRAFLHCSSRFLWSHSFLSYFILIT